jgi:MoxR-like ATPase
MVQSGKSHNNTDITSNGLMDLVSSIWTRGGKEKIVGPETPARPLFPLPASEAQNRIADLLINKQNPAVLVEGPPGSGKTQTIAK